MSEESAVLKQARDDVANADALLGSSPHGTTRAIYAGALISSAARIAELEKELGSRMRTEDAAESVRALLAPVLSARDARIKDLEAALVRALWVPIADDSECTCGPGDECYLCQATRALGEKDWISYFAVRRLEVP